MVREGRGGVFLPNELRCLCFLALRSRPQLKGGHILIVRHWMTIENASVVSLSLMLVQVAEVEDVVNEKISKELPVYSQVAPLDQASDPPSSHT